VQSFISSVAACSVSRLLSNFGIPPSEPATGAGRAAYHLVVHSLWNEFHYVWLGMVLCAVVSSR
jgi:hypothetical protein